MLRTLLSLLRLLPLLLTLLIFPPPRVRAETADLREYGRVTATFSPDRAEFVCQDSAKADMVLGKLLADLFWDAADAHTRKTVRVGQTDVLVHAFPPYGVLAVGRRGVRVLAVGADTEAHLRAKLTAEPTFSLSGTAYAPQKAYPLALDFFDLRAFRSYTASPMGSSQGFGLDSHWPFLKKFGMNAIAFQQPAFNFFNPAPGVVDWAAGDYEVREAERQGGLVIPSFDTGGVAPLWFYNKYPGSRAQPSPTTLLGHWGRVGGASDYFESWYTPAAQRSEGDFAFERQVMARYGSSPAVGGWQVYAGEPGAEMGNHGLSTEFFDYGPAGQAGFRGWLRTVRGYTLAALGQRWYGDPAHYHTWDDVTIPDINGFFGGLDAASLRLTHGWQRRPSADKEELPAGEAGWVSVAAPPSQMQTFLPWQPAWYRCTFDADDWRKSGGEAYLVCVAHEQSQTGMSVWLNGKYLGLYKPESGNVGFKVTGLLQPGPNALLLKVPGDGKILGPVFLSREQPKVFPYLGRGRNAQYADLKDWQIYGIYSYHKGVFAEARRLDPERPMLLATDDIASMGDYADALAADYGMGIENTGREAFYFPWWPGLGYVNGFYATSEPSGVPVGSSLDRMMSWMLLDGDSAHQLFWDIENFQQREKDDAWFTRNKRRIQLFGKSLRAKPDIALLWSVRTSLLGNPLPWNWDIGRGELESAHFDNVYVTEREVLNGKVQDYPVLFDGGTALMDPPLAKAIRRYVQAGGTYVALHNTGQYTTLDPDAGPITDLTGFKIVSAAKRGKITFGQNLPLLQEWQGKQFEGEGTSLDWKNNQTAKGVGLALSPAASDTVALARWDDGSVAVGYRKLGKGRIVVLGSTFWRSGKDTSGVWLSGSELERHFFETLFGDLGVRRTADSDSSDVWARKFITKNGLQDWLIAYNSDDVPKTTTLALRVERRPEQVLDLLSNQPVPFTYTEDGAEGGWVHVPDVTLPVVGSRLFAVRRAGLAGGLSVWWHEKTKYWKRVPAPAPPPSFPARPSAPATLPFDAWRFQPDRDGAAGDAWKLPAFHDAKWRTLQRGPWNFQDAALKDYRGVGLYRASFHVPSDWAGHRILLGLYTFNNPIVYDKGEFFVNGHSVATYEARGWNQTLSYDVTDALRPGENVLAVRVIGGKEMAGLSGTVWLEPERLLSPVADLTDPWQVIGMDGAVKATNAAPLSVTARNVAQTVTVPAEWQGRDVYLHLETPDQNLSAIVVNGHPFTYTGFTHHFGTRTDLNVSLYLRAGQPNRIELWPFGTLPQGDGSVRGDGDGIRLSSARLGCEQGRANALFGSMIHPDDPVEPDAPTPFLALAAATASTVNLVADPGFEDWPTPDVPKGWEASDTPMDPKGPKQGVVTRDPAAHGGTSAVRITNGLATDITQVSQLVPVEPNSLYHVRGWYKGANIQSSDGNGVLIWTSPGPTQDFYGHASYTAQAPPTRVGTFGWQPFDLKINTGPNDGLLSLTPQLRRASGTVWFDDLEVVKTGTITPVESY